MHDFNTFLLFIVCLPDLLWFLYPILFKVRVALCSTLSCPLSNGNVLCQLYLLLVMEDELISLVGDSVNTTLLSSLSSTLSDFCNFSFCHTLSFEIMTNKLHTLHMFRAPFFSPLDNIGSVQRLRRYVIKLFVEKKGCLG